LLSVSCSSKWHCLAVGNYSVGGKSSLPMAAAWNGSAWHLLAKPPFELGGISCVRKDWCMAAGFDVAEFWNGSFFS
jgi:hypothetical protein